MVLAAQSVSSALLLLRLCVACPDVSSASPVPETGQSQGPGSSCPLPRVKPHAWAGRSPLSLPHYAHSPEVQQVPVGLGKLKVVSLQGSLDTWTRAKWSVSRTPFRRLSGHARHSPVFFFALASQFLPAKNASRACQNAVCLFQGSASMPASGPQSLMGPPPPHSELLFTSSILPESRFSSLLGHVLLGLSFVREVSGVFYY